MRQQGKKKQCDDRRQRAACEAEFFDLRFRALLPRADWDALPGAVRSRFSKRLANGKVALYAGDIKEARFSRIGWCMAQLLRVIGGPLPLRRDIDVPAAVCVAEDGEGGGQIWTRVYHHAKGFPQMINSAKRFAGPTGLEEHIGMGIGMALRVRAIGNGLAFTSDHYFWQAGKFRMRLPRWIAPGETKVRHIDRGHGKFDFTLRLKHKLFGELIWQRAVFRDQ